MSTSPSPVKLQPEGEMGQRIRHFDWAATPLGPIDQWPACLTGTVNLILHSPAPFLILWGREGLMLYNDAYTVIAADRHPRGLGQPIFQVWPEAVDFMKVVVEKCFKGQKLSFKDNTNTIYRNGRPEQIWMNLDFSPILDPAGKVSGILAITVDTTERVKAEFALRNSEERLQIAFQAAQEGIWDWDFKSDKAWWNDRYTEIIGIDIPENERSFNSINKYIHPEDVQKIPAALKDYLEGKGKFEVEYRIIRPATGEMRTILGKGKGLFDENGQVVRMTGIITDITERKLIEETLIKSEYHFRQIANSLPLVIWTASPEGGLTYISGQWEEIYGNPLKESLGTGWINFVHPEDVEKAGTRWTQSLQTGTKYETEFRVQHKTDGYHWILVRAVPIKNEHGEIISWYGSNTDITDRKTTEKALKESSAKFEKLLEAVPQMTWTNLPNGKINFYNQQWYNYTGLTFDETKEWGWKALVHPDDLNKTLKDYYEAVSSGGIFVTENRYRRFDGSYRWHLNRALPIKNDKDEITLFVGTATDIQEQKETEAHLEKLVGDRTLQLERSNNDLQQFAHVASHDLKEPLRKIKIFSGLLEEEFAAVLPEKAKNFLDKIQNASTRMQMMIDGVLTYSSQNGTQQQIEEIDLNNIIKNVLSDLEILINQKKAVVQTLALPTVEGATVLINQLFYNLIFNALKFSKPGLPPEIQISYEINGPDVKLYIKDNGIGFEGTYASKIFDTFFRLHSKDKYEGTGLGLALCKKIAERHQGSIAAESEPGKGATFIITLPLLQSKNII